MLNNSEYWSTSKSRADYRYSNMAADIFTLKGQKVQLFTKCDKMSCVHPPEFHKHDYTEKNENMFQDGR